MRIDAKNLLDRLGRNDFAYKEFEDRFTELELWPLLEALLRDPRLQAIDRAEAAAASEPEIIEPAPKASTEPLTGLFSRYDRGQESGPRGEAERKAPVQDVRAMLRQLSDLGSKGEI